MTLALPIIAALFGAALLFLIVRSIKAMNAIESLEASVADIVASTTKVQDQVTAVPDAIRKVIADYAAEHPGSVPADLEARIIAASQTLTDKSKVLLSQATALPLMFENQTVLGDPQGGVVE